MKYFLLVILFLPGLLSNSQAVDSTLFGEPNPDPEMDAQSITTSFKINVSKPLKKNVDLSSLMPPPGDQSPLGSCWSFAGIYAMRSFLDNEKRIPNYFLTTSGEADYSKIYSPEFNYNLEKGNVDDCQFSRYSDIMLQKALKETGCIKYSMFPYTKQCNNQPHDTLKSRAKENLKKNYVVQKIKTLPALKRVLSDGMPAIISLRMDDFFPLSANMKADPSNKFSPVWSEFHNFIERYHAMVVVGYNDTAQAIKVMNSWGPGWGNKGYAWISYTIINCCMEYACYPEQDKSEGISVITDSIEIFQPKLLLALDSLNQVNIWFSEGYFRVFNDLKIVLTGINVDKKIAVFKVEDPSGKEIQNFYIDIVSSKSFTVNDVKYTVRLSSAGVTNNTPWGSITLLKEGALLGQ